MFVREDLKTCALIDDSERSLNNDNKPTAHCDEHNVSIDLIGIGQHLDATDALRLVKTGIETVFELSNIGIESKGDR